MARMVATNSFITVTVGCCAVGVVIVCAVVVIVVGAVVFVGVSVTGDWVVVFVVVTGSDIPQLLLLITTSANNRKIRIMKASINVRFTQ